MGNAGGKAVRPLISQDLVVMWVGKRNRVPKGKSGARKSVSC